MTHSSATPHYDATSEHQTRVDWLVEMIGSQIIDGTLKPGQKISEPKLSERFGTSRAPLREAIRRLEERRLVSSKPRQGSRVARFAPADFVEMFHVREGLEGIAARLAASRISVEGLNGLRKHCERHRQALGDSDTAREFDLEFHRRLASASGCAMLAGLLGNEFYAIFSIYRRKYPRLPGRPEKAFRQHLAIVEALADRDAETAEFMVRRHVRSARQAFEAVLERQAEGGVGETQVDFNANYEADREECRGNDDEPASPLDEIWENPGRARGL